jgi:tetratricopeptide (TPR) repeat protein
MKRSIPSLILTSALGLAIVGCGNPPAGQAQQQQNPMLQNKGNLNPQNEFESAHQVQISADTHFAAGQFAESQGNLTQALEQYRKALTLNPNHLPTIYHAAIVYVKKKELAKAIFMWERYVKVTNGDAVAYANLGFAYELAGRANDAENAYQKGIRKDPTNSQCRVNYGLMLARKERFNEATVQLQTVLTEAEVHYNLASVYEGLNRREQARVEYHKALVADPSMKEAQARLAALN